MPVRVQGMKELRAGLRELPTIPSQVSTPFAAYVRNSLAQSFGKQSDPYGNAWAPYRPASIARGRKPPLLVETRALKGSRFVNPLAGAGIELGYSDPKADLFQFGTDRMVARPVLPDDIMPRAWVETLNRLWREKLRERFRG